MEKIKNIVILTGTLLIPVMIVISIKRYRERGQKLDREREREQEIDREREREQEIEREREMEKMLMSKINYTPFYFFVRGHIRYSFDTEKLYIFIKLLRLKFPNVKIIFQTWTNIECKNSESWRHINEKNEYTGLEKIKKYFHNEVVNNFNCLVIDDKNVKYYGSIEGSVCSSPCPKKGWKNMWYGIFEGLKMIDDIDKFVVSFRYDYFDISQSKQINYNDILIFIEKELQMESNKISFLQKYQPGVDNLYIGKIEKVKKLAEIFHIHLDDVEKKYPEEYNQEFLIPKIANTL